MSGQSEGKIRAARSAADTLAAAGFKREAEAVRSLCRSNSALAETASRLRRDNDRLRETLFQAGIAQ